jgi:tetratricopeptide (TPR) repeat protein
VVVHGALRRGDAGWQLRVRCLSVGDGFQVGAWRFTSPDPLAASDQVAAAVAHALTVDLEVPARRPAEAGDAARARALDLYFRGKRELRAHWFEPDAAAALLAEAHALAPDDPAVLAEHATAAARVASMAGARMESQNAAARALAERAVALAPERAEGWFALAVTHSTANRVTPAALAARAVLARSPGHLGAQELLGTILVEVGEPAAAVTRFRAVLASDPRSRVVGDLARAVALLGDWDGAVEVLRSQPEAGVAGLTWSRLRLWNPALPPPPPLPAWPMVPTLMREARQFYEALERGLVTDAVAEAALERLVLGHTGRMLAGLLQVSVEISVHLGDLPRSLGLLARAVDEGLVDRVWLDRCPVLAPLRAHGDYEGLARRVAERADAVLASLG